ncbi:MAG: hypothetical protein ACOH2M_14825 [Cypionkella sp.]|jgi:hypothetical protein
MTQALPRSRTKRATFGAALVFGLAYVAALGFIFAPAGSLSTRTSVVQASSSP